ncbi:ABC transporter substrate-binding protein [Nocardioides limicola]|uniref:ABC transporter substrate-binding protein n=1 Tax=Nocardioides limicola TaxID=2803368 RepID=UPI00193BB10C|nr:ABC transporter substrate-binding protein [Nocardioides sp. DJM-14]
MKIRSAAAASLALALALSACAPSDDAADDDGPITVGLIADLSGATADVGTPYHNGMLGYIDWLNDQGGIDGRQIRALAEDYAYIPDNAVTLYDRFIREGAVAIQGWGTGDTNILAERINDDEIPFMSASYDETLVDPSTRPYNFVVAPTYSDQMRVALNWIAEDAGGEAGVAVFHHDSAFGQAPLADGAAWVEEQGLDLSLTNFPMPGDGNMVGLLRRAHNQNKTYVVIQNVSTPAANVARDLADQGLDMTIVCLNWCGDEIFIDTAGPAAAEGHVFVQPFTPPQADVPGLADVAEYLDGRGQTLEDVGLHYAQGWYTMHVMAEGIRRALDGGSLSGEAIKEALESAPIETGGVVGGGTVSFSPDSHRGSSGTGIYRVENGEMTVVELGVTP